MLRLCMRVVLFVAILCAAVRLTIIASIAESGWGFIATQWQDAFFGVAGHGHTPIGDRTPTKQADYWLLEVDSAVSKHPHSAPVHLGAAWVLDSPDIGFMQNHMKQSEYAEAFPPMGLELDEKAISAAKAKFREKCGKRCLELAEQATQLEPEDVRWWRMRALLQFEGDSLWSGQDFGPRSDDCLLVLDQCKQHDTKNALYDYLAASLLWHQSATYEWPDKPAGQTVNWVLTIHDADKFADGTKRFLQGQAKDFLAIGEAGYPAVPQFLEGTHTRKSDQAKVSVSRLVTFRHSILFMKLWRWQMVRADNARSANDTAQELSILRQNLKLYDQAVAAEETSALNTLTSFGSLRQSTYESIDKFARGQPTLVGTAEMAILRQREEELRIEAATLQSALQKLDDESYPKQHAASLPLILPGVASISVAVLLGFAAVVLFVARILARGQCERTSLGVLRHVIAWGVGCGGTFLVFGMAPAEMISHEAQQRAIIACIWAMAICLTGAAVWCVVALLRRRRIRFRLVTLLAVMTGVAILAMLWPLVEMAFGNLAVFPPELWPKAKGWGGIDAEVFRSAVKLDKGTWLWATIQWFAHGGPYITLVASLVLISVWFMWRRAKDFNEPRLSYWTQHVRTRWADLFRFVGKSALVAASCWLLIYLWIAPDSVLLAEAEFQDQMQYCRDPIGHYREIRNAQSKIKSSASEMAAIRRQVQFGLSGDGVLETDFGKQ